MGWLVLHQGFGGNDMVWFVLPRGGGGNGMGWLVLYQGCGANDTIAGNTVLFKCALDIDNQ